MRPFIGWSVFCLGLLVLGVWSRVDHAPSIETKIVRQVEALTTHSPNITAQVTGRDILLRGEVGSAEEKTRIIAAIKAIPGRRIIRETLQVMPQERVPSLQLSKGDPGRIAEAGILTAVELAGFASTDPGVQITTLNQRTDPEWIETARSAIGALELAEVGEAEITGSVVHVSAQVDTEADARRLRSHVALAPEGYNWVVTLEVLRPPVSPFTFSASRSGPVWLAHGVVGSKRDEAAIRARLDNRTEPHLRLGTTAPAGWMDVVGRGLESLDMLDYGQFEAKGRSLQISGLAGSHAVVERIEARFEDLPPLYSATLDLQVTAIAMAALTDGVQQSDIADAIAAPAVADMPGRPARLEDIGSKTVTLDTPGKPTPRPKPLPETETPPYGPATPGAAFSIRYNVTKGVFIGGSGPAGVSVEDLRDALGLPVLTGTLRQADAPPLRLLSDRLERFAPYLRYFERFEIVQEGDRITLTGTVLPGIDVEILQSDMNATIALPDSALVRGQDRVPSEGFLRLNRITGNLEVFRDASWQVSGLNETQPAPVPRVVQSAEMECKNATRSVLERGRINFATGSTEPTERSGRVLDNLADVIVRCLATDGRLRVEIGGHDDATGEGREALTLSADRAQSVVEALVIRGVLADRIVVRGDGDTRIVANKTADGGSSPSGRVTVHWAQR